MEKLWWVGWLLHCFAYASLLYSLVQCFVLRCCYFNVDDMVLGWTFFRKYLWFLRVGRRSISVQGIIWRTASSKSTKPGNTKKKNNWCNNKCNTSIKWWSEFFSKPHRLGSRFNMAFKIKCLAESMVQFEYDPESNEMFEAYYESYEWRSRWARFIYYSKNAIRLDTKRTLIQFCLRNPGLHAWRHWWDA